MLERPPSPAAVRARQRSERKARWRAVAGRASVVMNLDVALMLR
jgi:hypothetical protein